MTKTISEARFADLAAAYGADIALWPAEEQVAAQALARVSPAAGAALDDARQLDAALALLAAEPAPEPSAALTARILAAAAESRPAETPAPAPRAEPAPRPLAALTDWLFGGFGSAAACASAAAFGLWLGYAGPISVADAATLAFGVETGVEDDAFELVSASPFIDDLEEESVE